MSTIVETSISFEYVPNWGLEQAIRELIQNCIDNKGHVSNDDETLSLINENTVLSTQSLYLGVTDKRDDKSFIGQHGEGLKLALLVLAREKIEVEIINGSSVWIPFFKKNDHGVRVLCIKVEERNLMNSSFRVTIKGDLGFDIHDLYLGLGTVDQSCLDSDMRLSHKKHAGRLYSNGLYVSDIDSIYGYNLNGLELERDRSIACMYDLQCKLKDLWERLVENDEELGETLAGILFEGRKIEASCFTYQTPSDAVARYCAEYMKENQKGKIAVKEGSKVFAGKSMAVSSAFSSGLGRTYFTTNPVRSREQRWWDSYSSQLSSEAAQELMEILGVDSAKP